MKMVKNPMKIIIEKRFKDPDSIFNVKIMAVHERKMFIMFEDSKTMERFIDYMVKSADEDIREHLIEDMMIGKKHVYVGITMHYFNDCNKFLIYDNEAFMSNKE